MYGIIRSNLYLLNCVFNFNILFDCVDTFVLFILEVVLSTLHFIDDLVQADILRLGLHHQTPRHSHLVDKTENVDFSLLLGVLDQLVNADKRARSTDTGRAVNNRRAGRWKAVHLASDLTHETHQWIKWIRHAIVGPYGEMKLEYHD